MGLIDILLLGAFMNSLRNNKGHDSHTDYSRNNYDRGYDDGYADGYMDHDDYQDHDDYDCCDCDNDFFDV